MLLNPIKAWLDFLGEKCLDGFLSPAELRSLFDARKMYEMTGTDLPW